MGSLFPVLKIRIHTLVDAAAKRRRTSILGDSVGMFVCYILVGFILLTLKLDFNIILIKDKQPLCP